MQVGLGARQHGQGAVVRCSRCSDLKRVRACRNQRGATCRARSSSSGRGPRLACRPYSACHCPSYILLSITCSLNCISAQHLLRFSFSTAESDPDRHDYLPSTDSSGDKKGFAGLRLRTDCPRSPNCESSNPASSFVIPSLHRSIIFIPVPLHIESGHLPSIPPHSHPQFCLTYEPRTPFPSPSLVLHRLRFRFPHCSCSVSLIQSTRLTLSARSPFAQTPFRLPFPLDHPSIHTNHHVHLSTLPYAYCDLIHLSRQDGYRRPNRS